MPRVAKKEVLKREPSSSKMIDALARRVQELEEIIKELREEIAARKTFPFSSDKEVFGDKVPSIQHIETYNQEMLPPPNDTALGLKMNSEEKIQSMRNAIKVLPPNYVVNGRHTKQNIQALVGFIVTDELMDEAYQGITHEAF